MNKKKYAVLTLLLSFVLLVMIGGIMVFIDPLFHYHKPLTLFKYPINDERYQNDGILRNFDYDAIITGTSYTENFKSSELDSLFGTNSIKTPAYGSTFYEINNRLKTAFKHNKNIKIVLRSLDPRYIEKKDRLSYEKDDFPRYLYDDNILNDIEYIFNKEMLYKARDVIKHTNSGEETTSFDDYAFWGYEYEYGKDAVLNRYERPQINNEIKQFTEEDEMIVSGNIQQNIIDIARENKSTEFYLFLRNH